MGLFRYPKAVWADDADLSRSELETAIEKMVESGLIDYSDEDEVVRIGGWFMKKNAPENASRMASLAADYSTLAAPDGLLLASSAEFAVGSIKRAQRWKSDSSEWEKLRGVFKPFLGTMRQNFEDDFHAALASQMTGQNRAVKAEICALMPSLQHYLEAPCPHPADTVGAHDTYTTRDLHDTDTTKYEIETSFTSDKIARPPDGALPVDADDAEKKTWGEGPRSETIEAARRIGALE